MYLKNLEHFLGSEVSLSVFWDAREGSSSVIIFMSSFSVGVHQSNFHLGSREAAILNVLVSYLTRML